jgi:xanthine dehydrogenase/oxidase
MAALSACSVVNQKLKPVIASLPANSSWQTIVQTAISQGINLQSTGWTNPGPPPNGGQFQYNSYSAVVSQVYLDILTGETQIERCDILFDSGISLNPAVDIGQVEGAFTMGLGYNLTEDIIYDTTPAYGGVLSAGTWEYKVPSSMDIPIELNVTLLKNSVNPVGFLSSKCSGEPPLCLGCSLVFAVQYALLSSYNDRGLAHSILLNFPSTIDVVSLAAKLDWSDLQNH